MGYGLCAILLYLILSYSYSYSYSLLDRAVRERPSERPSGIPDNGLGLEPTDTHTEKTETGVCGEGTWRREREMEAPCWLQLCWYRGHIALHLLDVTFTCTCMDAAQYACGPRTVVAIPLLSTSIAWYVYRDTKQGNETSLLAHTRYLIWT